MRQEVRKFLDEQVNQQRDASRKATMESLSAASAGAAASGQFSMDPTLMSLAAQVPIAEALEKVEITTTDVEAGDKPGEIKTVYVINVQTARADGVARVWRSRGTSSAVLARASKSRVARLALRILQVPQTFHVSGPNSGPQCTPFGVFILQYFPTPIRAVYT